MVVGRLLVVAEFLLRVTDILMPVTEILPGVAVAVQMDFVRLASVADGLPIDADAALTVAVSVQTVAVSLQAVADLVAHDAALQPKDSDAIAKDIVDLPSDAGQLRMLGDRLPIDADRLASGTDRGAMNADRATSATGGRTMLGGAATTAASLATDPAVAGAVVPDRAASLAGGPPGATEFAAGVAAPDVDVDVGDVAVGNAAVRVCERAVWVWATRSIARDARAGSRLPIHRVPNPGDPRLAESRLPQTLRTIFAIRFHIHLYDEWAKSPYKLCTPSHRAFASSLRLHRW